MAAGRDRSRLKFTGLQVNYGKRPSALGIAKIAQDLRREDSGAWILSAKEMSKDLRRRNH